MIELSNLSDSSRPSDSSDLPTDRQIRSAGRSSSFRATGTRAATALAALGAFALLPLLTQPAQAASEAAPRPELAAPPPSRSASAPSPLGGLQGMDLIARAATTTPEFTRQRSVWDDLAMCESSGDWHINTGNTFYGGLQFWQPTWELFGGLAYARRADLATPQQQIDIAEAVLRVQGWDAWPVCSRKIGRKGFERLVHTVQPGETLGGIAELYDTHGGWPALYSLNRSLIGDDPDMVEPGMVLTVT
ncbi:transglycosylase family protein [Actinacidiphila yeochonensis]|uniref:transglycosylase family protein n=1 Tax=Actinacidiphila yeochonensis TaxID=89050 RepID=UPI00099BFE13|nr:transglycosylase family protein [Actinacidiphila yeochonensis]